MEENSLKREKLAWNLREAATACGLSVAYLRKQIEAGQLKTLRVGRRVLIADAELRRWLGLPPSEPAQPQFAILAEHRDVM